MCEDKNLPKKPQIKYIYIYILDYSLPKRNFLGLWVMKRTCPSRVSQKKFSQNWSGRTKRLQSRGLNFQHKALVLELLADLKTQKDFSVLTLLTSIDGNNSHNSRELENKKVHLTAGPKSSTKIKISHSFSNNTKVYCIVHDFRYNISMLYKTYNSTILSLMRLVK